MAFDPAAMGGRGGGAPAAAPAGGGGGMQIGGALPWGGGGAGALSGNPAAAYASAYNDALAMNKSNYSNILAGYNQTMQNQQSTQQGIIQGYGQLTGDVMGLIAGTDSAQRQALADQYQQNRGQASQSLIDRGLGNTTVQSSVDRGLQYDYGKSQVNLANQFAQLNAQYRTQLGLSGLDYRNQANMQNTGLANQQLQWMNSVNAGYPNASMYAQLAAQKGALKTGAPGFSGVGGGTVTSDGGGMKNPFGNLMGGYSNAGSGYAGGGSYGGYRPAGGTAYGGPSQSVYPGGNYPLDPADPFWSTGEGQDAGGGTMGVNSYGFDQSAGGDFGGNYTDNYSDEDWYDQ